MKPVHQVSPARHQVSPARLQTHEGRTTTASGISPSTSLRERAEVIRRKNFGNALRLHSVIYPIDYCGSGCTYCGLSSLLAKQGAHGNRGAMRDATFSFILNELSDFGYNIHELVFGTISEDQNKLAGRIAHWVERARELAPSSYIIVNCDTLQPSGYRTLKAAGADAIWTFIELMSPDIYRRKHLSGLKADQPQRLEAPGRIRDAGLEVGNALLWGLTPDWRHELDQFVAWSEAVGGFDFVATPVQQALTLPDGKIAPDYFDVTPPFSVSTDAYSEICANLRVAFPTSHLVANTRVDPTYVYGNIALMTDMCNGYVWTGARSHDPGALEPARNVRSAETQMDFFNPGVDPSHIQQICHPDIEVRLTYEPPHHN